MERVIGTFEGQQPGPLVIFIGGLHGNESAGIKAIRRVFQTLEEEKLHINGKILGVVGNVQAAEQNVRFIDYDLNRCWLNGQIQYLKSKGFKKSEDKEAYELYKLIEEAEQGEYTSKIIVDLHTTSSDKGNFIVIPEDEAQHPVVKALRLPTVVDLDLYLKGTLLKYFHKRGFLSFAFEGGLIGSSKALLLHTSGIWEVLRVAGSLQFPDNIEFSIYQNTLESIAEDLPSRVKVLYHHWVEEQDKFSMYPGFENFQFVEQGKLIAKDKKGDILSPCDGLIFMPLYQESGNDGFFIVDVV